MKGLLAAISFLTPLPLPACEISETALRRAPKYFPLVGLLIGFFVAGLYHYVLGRYFPPLPAAALAVGLLFLASAGFHLDGLSDSADGLLSSRPREQKLEIMRDSRVGAMGAIALVMILLLKFSAIASLDRDVAWKALLLAPLIGRASMLYGLSSLPYARKDGLAKLFFEKTNLFHLLCGIACAVLLAIFTHTQFGIKATAIAFLLAILWGEYCRRKLGGMTGDTLGATSELCETATLLALSAGMQPY